MNTSPEFSIITICLNEESAIQRTCESVCSQTFRDFEWIVIDGGSTDSTLEILELYRDRIAGLVSEPDSGIFHAMNKGVAVARGEYVVFMNGGDCFFDEGALEAAAAAPRKDILYGDLVFEGAVPSVKTYPDQLLPGYLLKNMLPHQASFIRKSLFDRHGLYDESYRIAGDYELFVRFVEVNRVAHHHIARVLAVLGDGGISRSQKHRMSRKQENHRVRKQYFPRYRYSLKGVKEELRNRLLAIG